MQNYANDMFRVVVQADQTNENYDNSGSFQAYNSTLADKQPLTEADLTKLEGIVKVAPGNRNEQQRADYNSLLNRMKADGLKFDGTNELKILENILGTGKRVLKGDPRSAFLGFYKDGVGAAIGGLQNIDNVKYTSYKAARDGGAPHDEAWTWANGGPTAQRRYELGRLLDQAK